MLSKCCQQHCTPARSASLQGVPHPWVWLNDSATAFGENRGTHTKLDSAKAEVGSPCEMIAHREKKGEMTGEMEGSGE